jgi:hypothetical protein
LDALAAAQTFTVPGERDQKRGLMWEGLLPPMAWSLSWRRLLT